MQERRRHLILSLSGLVATYAVGVAGFYALGRGDWSLMDCIYMATITLSTVGFHEAVPVSTVAGGKLFTSVLVVGGVAAVLYFATTVVAFLVEGDLQELWGNRRMEKMTRTLSGHFIVCGVGRTGRHTVENLCEAGETVLLVDQNEQHIQAVLDDLRLEVPYVVGDATEEAVLEQCAIHRARGIICALDSDQANLYVVLTAKNLNPKLRVVAKAGGRRAVQKFRMVGADSVVSTTEIGGQRLFLEAVQPEAARFLESLLLPRQMDLSVREIRVAAESPLGGHTLAEADLRNQVGNVLVLAVRPPGQSQYEYHIGPNTRLEPGCSLMAMAHPEDLRRLEALAARA